MERECPGRIELNQLLVYLGEHEIIESFSKREPENYLAMGGIMATALKWGKNHDEARRSLLEHVRECNDCYTHYKTSVRSWALRIGQRSSGTISPEQALNKLDVLGLFSNQPGN